MAKAPSPANPKHKKLLLKTIQLQLPGKPPATLPAADALRLLQQAQQQGNRPLAFSLAQQLTQQLPALDTPWLTLFGALHDMANFAALARESERCLAAINKFLPALVSGSVAARMLQNYPQALSLIEKAVALEPANAQVVNHLAITLKEMGQPERALKEFNRCLRLQPDNISAIWNRADMAGVLSDDEYQRVALLADNARFNAHQRAMLHYALSMSDEKAGRYPEQFSHIEQGAALKRSTLNYAHEKEMAQTRSIAGFFPAAEKQIPGTTNYDADTPGNQPVPIFICGLPRSGTTLTEQILSNHPLVMAGDEINDLPIATAKLLQKKGNKKDFPQWANDLTDADWKAIGDDYLNTTRYLQNGGFFTDKNLNNYKAIGVIRKALPQAKIVICQRNAMDNCWGCYRQFFVDGMAFTYDLKELADTWNTSDQLIRHWLASQPETADVFVVRYEELVQAPDTVIRALVNFCGLPWDDACLNFHTNPRPVKTLSAMQVRQSMTTSRLEQWRRYENQLAPLADALATQPNG
ncbi:sulfotransferase [Thalassolituus sp. LLYu03]|uniref:sulfotransferase family protein n=1 Tax=Thalassolituus sp. LLYu03 TaxID=3421656 RepID=UPI003D2ACE91